MNMMAFSAKPNQRRIMVDNQLFVFSQANIQLEHVQEAFMFSKHF